MSSFDSFVDSDSEEDNLIIDDVAGKSDDEETKNVPEVIKSVPSTSTIPNSDKKTLQVSKTTRGQDDEDHGVVAKDDPARGGCHGQYSPPCITIKEEDGKQPIRINIAGRM